MWLYNITIFNEDQARMQKAAFDAEQTYGKKPK